MIERKNPFADDEPTQPIEYKTLEQVAREWREQQLALEPIYGNDGSANT